MKTNIFNYISRDEFKQFIEHANSLCVIMDRMTEAIDMYNHSCERDDADIDLNEIACLVFTRCQLNTIRDKSHDLLSDIDTNFGEIMFDKLLSRFDDVCNSFDLYDKSQEDNHDT